LYCPEDKIDFLNIKVGGEQVTGCRVMPAFQAAAFSWWAKRCRAISTTCPDFSRD